MHYIQFPKYHIDEIRVHDLPCFTLTCKEERIIPWKLYFVLYLIIFDICCMNIFDFWSGSETSTYYGVSMRKILLRKRQTDGLCVLTIHHHHILCHQYSHIRCYLNMLILQLEALYIFQCNCLGNIFPQDKYFQLKSSIKCHHASVKRMCNKNPEYTKSYTT